MSPNENLLHYGSYINSSFRIGGLLVLSFSVALSEPTDWSADSVRLGTVAEGGRPAASRGMHFSVMVFDSSGGLSMRTADLGTDGRVVLRTTGVDKVVAARVVGIPVYL